MVEESYGEAETGASFAEKARLFVVGTFVVCALDFLVMTCVWRSCWRNKRHYWAYRILFMLCFVPGTALAVALMGRWATAEGDVHDAYAALASSPANECGDTYTKYPYEISGMTVPTIPRTGQTLLWVAVGQLAVLYLNSILNIAFGCYLGCGKAGPVPD